MAETDQQMQLVVLSMLKQSLVFGRVVKTLSPY